MTQNGVNPPPGIYRPGPNNRESFSLCIYGRGGSGKTSLLGTMPGKGLVIDVPQIEGGTFVLAPHAGRIDIVPVTTWQEIQPIFWWLKKGGHEYKWVAMDTITAMTQLAIRKVAGERALDVDPAKVTQQDWGIVGRMVGELVFQFRTLPIHTVWLAQERQYGSEGESKVIGPDTSPAARQMLLPPLLLCARLFIEYGFDGTPERHLRIQPHQDFDAKIRARAELDVPAVIRNPHLGKLLAWTILGKGEPPEKVDDGIMLLS